MSMQESGRRGDPFSQQVQRITRSQRIEKAFPLVGDTVGVNLIRHNARSLDRMASRLERYLHPSSASQISDEMYARLWGSLLTIKGGSAIIKEMRREKGKSLREVSAAERNDTNPRVKDQRQTALRKAFTTAIEDIFSEEHTWGDVVSVAILTANAVVTADQDDMEIAAAQLGWMKFQAESMAASKPEYSNIVHIAEGMLDIVRPVLGKTQVLFAA